MRTLTRLPILVGMLLAPLALAGCDKASSAPTAYGGNARHGIALIEHYGCGACHSIPGIGAADGLVGPPLTSFSRRVYVAGLLRNTPENLILWLRDPQKIVPGNVMPEMGLSEQDARDIAAYLYTIR